MNDDRPTPAEVIAKLGGLSTPEIRRLFVDLGVWGRRRSSMTCPVANYVRAETGVPVNIGQHLWRGTDIPITTGGVTPMSVSVFVEKFDDGKYPELES